MRRDITWELQGIANVHIRLEPHPCTDVDMPSFSDRIYYERCVEMPQAKDYIYVEIQKIIQKQSTL